MELLIIYIIIGVCFVTLLALGVGRMEVHAELLGREVPRKLIIGCALAGAFVAWPVVLWLLIVGKRDKTSTIQHGE